MSSIYIYIDNCYKQLLIDVYITPFIINNTINKKEKKNAVNFWNRKSNERKIEKKQIKRYIRINSTSWMMES